MGACSVMSNRVNKKLMVKSCTSTNEVLSLKKQLKLYQLETKELKKLIKFHEQQLKDLTKLGVVLSGKTQSTQKAINKTLEKLNSFLLIYEDGVKVTSYEIQINRQRTFEGLCNYHPDKEVAKKRMIEERDGLKSKTLQDNEKLKNSVDNYRNEDHGKDFESFKLFDN